MARRAPGEGTIIPTKDGKWKAVLSLGTIGGRRVRRSKKAKTKADAAAFLREMRKEAGRAKSLACGKLTVSELVARYMSDHVALRLAPSTHASYDLTANGHILPHLGTVLVSDLSPVLISGVMAELSRNEVGGRTQQNAFDVLRSALNWAATMGLIASHPMQGLCRPKHHYREMQPFTQEQATKLICETVGERTNALVQVALTTGMRQGELFGLEWSRIDMQSARIRVEQAVSEVNGKLYLRKPKTKRSVRTINVTPETIATLIEHKALLLRSGIAASEFVFPSPVGGMQSRINFGKRTWRPLLKRLGISHRGAHNLRHTFATLALGAGVPVHVVSQMMGHSSPSITLDVYSHVLPADQDHATRAMTRLFG